MELFSQVGKIELLQKLRFLYNKWVECCGWHSVFVNDEKLIRFSPPAP